MSSTSDKIKGVTNEVVGKTKQALGSATDNHQLRRDGVAQEVKGNAQQAVGKAKDAVKKVIDKA
ncbi:MAG: CsbD family protein [Elstera sp.]